MNWVSSDLIILSGLRSSRHLQWLRRHQEKHKYVHSIKQCHTASFPVCHVQKNVEWEGTGFRVWSDWWIYLNTYLDLCCKYWEGTVDREEWTSWYNHRALLVVFCREVAVYFLGDFLHAECSVASKWCGYLLRCLPDRLANRIHQHLASGRC